MQYSSLIVAFSSTFKGVFDSWLVEPGRIKQVQEQNLKYLNKGWGISQDHRSKSIRMHHGRDRVYLKLQPRLKYFFLKTAKTLKHADKTIFFQSAFRNQKIKSRVLNSFTRIKPFIKFTLLPSLLYSDRVPAHYQKKNNTLAWLQPPWQISV